MTQTHTFSFHLPADFTPQSLEKYLAIQLEEERLVVRRWIEDGYVTVDGQTYKPRRYIYPHQLVEGCSPPLTPHPAEPQDLPLDILYQDAHLIVVNKPGDMATHPSAGWWQGSCVNALLFQIKDWQGIGGVAGPGIVHRLDKDTSGLLVFAKTKPSLQVLLAAVKQQKIKRHYIAWVEGQLKGQGTVDKPLGRNPANPYTEAVLPSGKPAITHYKSLLAGETESLIQYQLETGRTHQIRVHMASLGHPVWGDKLYGQEQAFMALHAYALAFEHPVTQQYLHFTVEPPQEWWRFGRTDYLALLNSD